MTVRWDRPHASRRDLPATAGEARRLVREGWRSISGAWCRLALAPEGSPIAALAAVDPLAARRLVFARAPREQIEGRYLRLHAPTMDVSPALHRLFRRAGGAVAP